MVDAFHEIMGIQRDRDGFLLVAVHDARNPAPLANRRGRLRADALSQFRL
jgi:hypothetical protein